MLDVKTSCHGIMRFAEFQGEDHIAVLSDSKQILVETPVVIDTVRGTSRLLGNAMSALV